MNDFGEVGRRKKLGLNGVGTRQKKSGRGKTGGKKRKEVQSGS